MLNTKSCIIASFTLILGIGLGVAIANIISLDDIPQYEEIIPIISHTPDTGGFKQALLPLMQTRFGTSTSSFEPQKILYVYPGLAPQDFDGVQAMDGTYQYRDGFLWFIGNVESGETANDVSDDGYVTLHRNVRSRLGEQSHISSVDLVSLLLTAREFPPESEIPTLDNDQDLPVENLEEPTMCPMDVKSCPDGSFVSRTAPGCAFAECPSGGAPQGIVCTPEQREAEACIEIYAPVCAAQQVQCITTPCEPVPTTYPNSCFACAEETVISYTEGACEL